MIDFFYECGRIVFVASRDKDSIDVVNKGKKATDEYSNRFIENYAGVAKWS